MLEEFAWNPAPIENAGHKSVRYLHFEIAVVVPEVQAACGPLMELMDELGQLSAANLTPCPPPEGFRERNKGTTQLLLVCHRRLLTEESLLSICTAREPPLRAISPSTMATVAATLV